MNKLSASLRSFSPSLWQYLKYKQYMLSNHSEREYISLRDIFVRIEPRSTSVFTWGFIRGTSQGLRSRSLDLKLIQPAQNLLKRFGKSVRIEWSAVSSDGGSATLRIPVRAGDVSALGTISDANRLEGHEFTEVVVPKRGWTTSIYLRSASSRSTSRAMKSRYSTAPRELLEGIAQTS